jgi:hypothetical protein
VGRFQSFSPPQPAITSMAGQGAQKSVFACNSGLNCSIIRALTLFLRDGYDALAKSVSEALNELSLTVVQSREDVAQSKVRTVYDYWKVGYSSQLFAQCLRNLDGFQRTTSLGVVNDSP